MLNWSEAECLQAIEQARTFHARIDGAFEVKIEDYGVFICTAIHDGHGFREELQDLCLLSDAERLFEEDPFTGEMISAMPMTIIGCDSRYEYDLNRGPDNCVYEKEAWGKQVWRTPVPEEAKARSLEKHARFYRVLAAMIRKVEQLHGNCLVYDMHSYNHLRILSDVVPPVFNIGTVQLDVDRWRKAMDHWCKVLDRIKLPNVESRSGFNEIFWGKGYLATFVTRHFKNTLVLPTEVKKVFMDELSGEPYPLVLDALKSGLKKSFVKTAGYFAKRYRSKAVGQTSAFLSSDIEPAVRKLDQKLFRLCRGIETLAYINPKNIIREKKRFFARGFNYEPAFSYRQLEINPFEFREALYRLPESAVTDISIQQLYRDVIDAYAMKIDLLTTIGTEKFLYNSLRYYGEPSAEDIQLAHFLLYAKPYESFEPRHIDAKQAKCRFMEALEEYQIDCKVEITDKIVASAMVDNRKKTILINKSMWMNEVELNALIHHELGVHMVTTFNAEQQPLNVFKLGLPGNTYTQEGLAILAEYMTGNLNLTRLKTLALRVIAVDMMVKHYDFSHTFKTLINDYGLDKDEAFRLTARVYRGGGFTKDYLYLRGLKDALRLQKTQSLKALYVGKTGFQYLQTINEMMARGMVASPTFLPMYLQRDMQLPANPILDYLLACGQA